jgi:hypothetical protein
MRRVALTIIFNTAFLFPAFAATAPVLHQRCEADQPSQATAKGFSSLPEEASGEYVLDRAGSVIQITIEQNRLTGYVTKMAHGTALTLFFDRTTLAGNHLSFTTKTVHGLRYSFIGTIVRVDASSAAQSGFYRLAGGWTTYRNDGRETVKVNLLSTPRLR